MSITKHSSRRHRLFSVIRIAEYDRAVREWVKKTEFTKSMSAPIIWKNEPAEIHFWNYNKKCYINRVASKLFDRDGFKIRGPVLILTGSDMFEVFRTEGSPEEVKADLAGLGLSEKPVVMSGRDEDGYPRTNVYVRDENDAFAVRMRLK